MSTATYNTNTRLDALISAHGQQGGTIFQFNTIYNVDLLKISNLAFFALIHGIYLKRCLQTNPERYNYGLDKLEIVLDKFFNALCNGTYSKDGDAIKLTIKAIGLKNTYKCINAYLNS